VFINLGLEAGVSDLYIRPDSVNMYSPCVCPYTADISYVENTADCAHHLRTTRNGSDIDEYVIYLHMTWVFF
jgi:hypothetical protein